MPDNPNDRGDKAPAVPLRDGTNKFYEDAYKNAALLRSPGVCASCHPKEETKFDSKTLDFFKNDFGRFDKFKDLPPRIGQAKPADVPGNKPADKPVEVKVKTEAEKFEQADALGKTTTVIARLPDFKINFADKKLALQTDFVKLVEATPGITAGGEVRDILAAAKKVTFDAADKFTLDLKDVVKLKIDRDVPLVGKVTELNVGNAQKQVKFDVEFDPKNPDKVSIKNISGITLAVEGKGALAIHSLSLDTSGDKPQLKVTVDNPIKRPSWIDEKNYPKTLSVPFDLDKVVPGLNSDFLKGMVKTLSDSKTALQNRDASMLLSGLPDEGVRTKLIDMVKGLQTIEKKGNHITIVRDNGVTEHDFGGPRLSVSATINFTLETNGGGIDVKEIRGIDLWTPLPTEAGLGDRYSVGIKGISLSPKYGDSRALTVSADKLVDSVKIRLNDKDLLPATDANGNWRLDIRMTNPLDLAGTAKINVPLKFNQSGDLAMSNGEIAGLAQDIVQSGAKSNVIKAVQVIDNKANQIVDAVDRKATQALDIASMAATVTKSVVKSEVRNIIDYWTK